MDIKKIVIPIIGAGTLLTGVLLKHNSRLKVSKAVSEAVTEPEQVFGGIPISQLNELAKSIYHGVKVTIDKFGFLVFHYTSNSGKTTLHPQMWINELGKLEGNVTHYPGQWWSSADEFIKRANELFTFKK